MMHLIDQFDHAKKEQFKFILNVLVILGFVLAIYALYLGFEHNLFTSKEALETFLYSVGPIAPLIFIFIQILQTVLLIIPRSIVVPIGLFVFGIKSGSVLSFIGIISGSLINFGLSRKYGHPFVELIGNKKKINKYMKWTEDSNRFDQLFAFGMFFPFAPSNFLCYLAGLSEISFRKFLLIVHLSTIPSLILFSFGVTELLKLIF